MSGLKDSIRQSKEERTKKLEALRAAKQAREEAKKRNTSFLDPTMREDMNKSYNSDISLNISSEYPSSNGIFPSKNEISIKAAGKIIINPKPRAISYEREIQVDVQTDSEDEEEIETKKGVRKTSFDKNIKQEKKEEDIIEQNKPKELEPDEAEAIISTPEFGEFFNRCAFVIENVLDEKFDVVEDFILQQKVEDPFDQKGKIKLLYELKYSNEDRCVSSLEWSPNYDDTIIASYIQSSLKDYKVAQGLINIWHLEDPSKPKHILNSQSPITQALLYPNDTNIVLGGSYTGQLLIWDLRAKALPIQRSPSLSKGHSFPIVGLSFAESRHSSNAISLSSDGKFCSWMMSLLQSPVETYEIKHRNELCVNCLDFLPEETWTYSVGTEEGTVINGVLQGNLNIEKEEITVTTMAPVTSVHNHPNSESGLLLVSSVDWTVKMYQKGSQRNILTIDAYDEYVYDVKWSPTNPCAFACCDGDGNLDVWDIGKSIEAPYVRQNTGNKALNKIGWDNNGFRIAAGNSFHSIYVYQLDKDYSHTKNEDWLKAILHLNN